MNESTKYRATSHQGTDVDKITKLQLSELHLQMRPYPAPHKASKLPLYTKRLGDRVFRGALMFDKRSLALSLPTQGRLQQNWQQ